MKTRFRKLWVLTMALALLAVLMPTPASAKKPSGYLTSDAPMLTLDPGLPGGARVKAIISSGEAPDELGGFLFEGLPDGIGIRPGVAKNTIDVYINHEQTTIPFFGTRDFEDASVSKLTLSTKGKNRGEVLHAEVAIPASAGFLRFCSASMAGPAEGLSSYMFLTGEEANDNLAVAPGAAFGSDPSIAPDREVGYAVVLNTDTGDFTHVAGLGRLNHESTIVVPGGWDDFALLTTDDTFSAPGAQLYLYLAATEADIYADEGHLYALRVTSANGVAVDETDPFNGANDYLDLGVGDDFGGEFIAVPDDVADGTLAAEEPQAGLEDWSNANNVFQAIRLEDLAYDKNDPRVVYIADTGQSRIVPDPLTGRMIRGPGGTTGLADNGRIWKLVMNEDDPLVVDSLTVLADGDAVGSSAFVPMRHPDNLDTSKKSLMVQEDASDAKIWQYKLKKGKKATWRVVATVTAPGGGESSGIVDASEWFGGGRWLLDVQGHGFNVAESLTIDPPNLVKRESGQLLLLKIPGS